MPALGTTFMRLTYFLVQMMPGSHATIYVDDGAGDQFVLGYGIDHLCYFVHFTHPVDQMQPRRLVGMVAMHGGTDNTCCDGIYTDIVLTEFSSQLDGKCMDCALTGNGRCSRRSGKCMIYQGRADVDDGAVVLLQHLGNDSLCSKIRA